MHTSKTCMNKAADMMQKNCANKINKLVYTEYPKISPGHCRTTYVPKISKNCGTRIRYCTAREVKLMAGKRPCDCPGEIRSTYGLGQFIMDTIKNVMKAALIFGVAYGTYGMGFWGSPKDTEDTFATICNAMPCREDPCKSYEFLPRTKECQQEMELLKIPPADPCENPLPIDMEKCLYKMKQLWNHSVILFFQLLTQGPGDISSLFSGKGVSITKNRPCYPECIPSEVKVKVEIKEDETIKCELVDDYDKYDEEFVQEDDEYEEQIKAFVEKPEEENRPCRRPRS